MLLQSSAVAVWGPHLLVGPGEGPVERRSAPGTDTDDGGTASPETGGECALMEFQLVLVRAATGLGTKKPVQRVERRTAHRKGGAGTEGAAAGNPQPRTDATSAPTFPAAGRRFRNCTDRTSYWTACARSSARSVLAHWKTVLVHRRTLCIFFRAWLAGTPSLM